MKSKLLVLALVMVSLTTQAQMKGHGSQILMGSAQKCLQMASNADLLNEVNRRMSVIQQPVQDESVVTIGCNFNVLVSTRTDMNTGETESSQFTLGNSSQCDEAQSLLQNKLNQNLNANSLVAVCNFNVLNRFLLAANKKLTQLDSTTYGNSSQCAEAAKQINK